MYNLRRGTLSLAGLLTIVSLICYPPHASATVVIQVNNYTFDAMADIPADFGPGLAPEGISGLLVIADPLEGCSRLEVPDYALDTDWIALISRSQARTDDCTFDIKVRTVTLLLQQSFFPNWLDFQNKWPCDKVFYIYPLLPIAGSFCRTSGRCRCYYL